MEPEQAQERVQELEQEQEQKQEQQRSHNIIMMNCGIIARANAFLA